MATPILHLVFLLCALISVNGEVKSSPSLPLSDGRTIPAFALGTWLGFTSQGPVQSTGSEVYEAVKWALESGYRHIDTAARYMVEDQVGRALSEKFKAGHVKREDVFVTTKLWNNAHAKDAVVPALKESLKRLQLDYVDLYLIHWPVGQFDNETFDNRDYLETWEGMVEAKKLGLTKSIGLSNFNEEQISRIIERSSERPTVLQVELNLNLQQDGLRAFCKERNIAIMAYTPFGSLFPSKATPNAPPPLVSDPALLDIAAHHNKTVPQVVLRYLFELGVIPIPKSVTKTRIEENFNIFDFKLTEEESAKLKSFNRNYRTIPQIKWQTHPYYPFEKKQ